MIRKLESIFRLSTEEKQALHDLPIQIQLLKADQDIVRIGDRPSQCCLLVEGYTCVYKLTIEGKRQIVAFYVPGDMPDLQSLHLKVLDNSLATVTPCTVGFIQHEDLRRVCDRYPRITAALWRETLVDASIFREWVLNVGRRDAFSRMAHVLCELLTRLRAVGLADDHTCDLPITQGEFADAIGVTPVHVNRVFQQMRADGLIELKGSRLNILDWERLKQAGEFDPTYLHLESTQAAA
jgi:CRP-like cAMP-binding protein